MNRQVSKLAERKSFIPKMVPWKLLRVESGIAQSLKKSESRSTGDRRNTEWISMGIKKRSIPESSGCHA